MLKGTPSIMSINKYHIQVLVLQAITIILAGCIILVVAWARTLSQPSRAQAFLSDVTKLEVGKSTFEEAKSVAQKHGGIPWWVSDGSMRCTWQECVFQFVFQNKPLTSTRVVPWVGLIGTVTVKDGVVTQESISYHRYAKRPFAYDVEEMVLQPAQTPEGRGMRRMLGLTRMNVDPDGVPSAVLIGLEAPSSSSQKKRAYAVDVSCLSKLFGCGNASSFFPPGIAYQGGPYQTHTESW